MWIRLASVALLLLITTGCSYVSLPSMPWSGPAVQPNPTAEALFDEGMRYYENKKYTLAIDRFQRVKAEFPFSPQLTAAELKIADAYFLNKQYPEAVAAFKEFQALHPTNENIPFVIYRLGESHFEQFTTTDRDQKMTEIAKGYFETLITSHPKSPYAEKAKENLAKCLAYLAEHEFTIASFYLREKKYPAARDRFEEILRKYRNTPSAVKSLFYLGETYREEKNGVKAALAYEALIQHYPESRLAGEAKTRLAQLEKEKHDPLAMLLIRERRPTFAAPPASALAAGDSAPPQNLEEMNLVAKKEVVYEEPGADRGFFSRMVDTLNPFSSSDKKEEPVKKTQTVKTKQAPPKEEESQGFFSSLWGSLNPFSSGSEEKKEVAKNPQLVGQIDQSLKQKGIDTGAQVASKPPESDLPKVEEPAAAPVDTKKLLGEIDTSLKKQGTNVAELPPTPEIAPVLNTPASEVQKSVPAATKVDSSASATGLLTNIDEKLKSQGIEPPKAELPLPSEAPARKEQPKKVELEPKLPAEKGPLYLERAEVETKQKPTPSTQETRNEAQEQTPEKAQQSPRTLPQSVVKGPPQSQPAKQIEPKPAEAKPSEPGEEETKGVFDQLREDVQGIGKILNPFSW